MQFWRCAECANGSSYKPYHDQFRACSKYHGQYTDGEHSSFWYVHVIGKPYRCFCNSRSDGRSDPYALYTRDTWALDTWFAYGHAGEDARVKQLL